MSIEVHSVVFEVPGLGNRFPVPPLGTQCVCCDAENVPRVAYEPGNSQTLADPVPVPLCDHCRKHVSLKPGLGTLLLGLSAGLGVLGAVSAVTVVHVSWLLTLSLLAIIVPVLAFIMRSRSQHADALIGHHRNFLIGVSRAFSVVRTTNPRLAEELCSRGGRPIRR